MVLASFLNAERLAGINYASVYGLQEDTGLKGQQYSWVQSPTLRPISQMLTISLARKHLLFR
jgi:hypothetical protein